MQTLMLEWQQLADDWSMIDLSMVCAQRLVHAKLRFGLLQKSIMRARDEEGSSKDRRQRHS